MKNYAIVDTILPSVINNAPQPVKVEKRQNTHGHSRASAKVLRNKYPYPEPNKRKGSPPDVSVRTKFIRRTPTYHHENKIRSPCTMFGALITVGD
ncbi:hypothetical protein NPIL_500221 [Nephila pilipes]|uniref:Uncharacterized protein n=1 Tax=Nephila pilipes TaxID=299642 RepID=A0A8X6U1R1_NEPPI|nr:hypothetical protein NPIL_500221 [Nephila pilipes]